MQADATRPSTAARARAIKVGVTASLAGTLAMDLVMIVESLILGEPVFGFLELIGSVVHGGVLVGAAGHGLMGSLLGLLFGLLVHRVPWLSIDSVRKGVWLGGLAGLVTIPLGCVPLALLIGVPVVEMVGFSFVPHVVWGAVMGAIAGRRLGAGPVGRGSRQPVRAEPTSR